MADRLFFCGTDPSAKLAKHSEVLWNFGPAQNIKLEPLAISTALAEEVPDRLLDLIDIASYVFAADRSVMRGGPHARGMGVDWRRDIRVHIAVRDPDYWSTPELLLTLRDLLGFMSEDEFNFEFVKRRHSLEAQSYFKFGAHEAEASEPSPIVLFSGGLDPLAGALEELNGGQDRVVLITHRSSPVMTRCQNDLAAELSRRFPGRILYVPVQMTLTRGLGGSETSQRTRTFLFSALAGTVASMLGANGIRFYENGVMSLNLPISPQVVGTAATRSTHPRTLREISMFLSAALGRVCAVDNPLLLKTKAEVLKVIAESGHPDLTALSISCTRVRRREKDRTHCGACVQCLHRRFASLAVGPGAHDPTELYALDLFTSERGAGGDRTMCIEFVRSAQQYLHLTDEGFFARFAGELSRVASSLEKEKRENLLRQLLDLHRRHGQQVTAVLEKGIEDHKAELSKGMLPSGCLLRCVSGEQKTRNGLPKTFHARQASMGGTDLMLAIDPVRNVFIIGGLPPMRNKSGVAVLVHLAEQHRLDTENRRAPESFSFVPAARLEQRLGIENAALRRRIERLRDRIAQSFLDHAKRPIDRELIVERVVHGRATD